MALRLQQRPTPALGLMLASSLLALLVLGGLAAATREPVFAALAVLAAIAAAHWTRLRLRIARQTPRAPLPSDALRSFVTGAGNSVGPRARDGFVVIGQDVAAFVPTSPWRHLGAELLAGLLVQRMQLSRHVLDARDTPALASELAELVRQRGGFMLDERWSWAIRGRVLWRADGQEFLRLKAWCPAESITRWPVLAAPPAERRRREVKLLAIGGAASGLLATAGVLAWRVGSNVDYLIAGSFFAVLVGGSVVAGVLMARRMLARSGQD